MLKDKSFTWKIKTHRLPLDKKGKLYCRALNSITGDDVCICQYCPLWDGNARELGCTYYDFEEISDSMLPKERKQYTDGVIKAGFTQEFPSFVSDTESINFSGVLDLPKWTKEEWLLVERAYQFAAQAHKGMTRKGTKIPYFTHPVEVAFYAFELSKDPEVVAAAVLHDVVEDTKYTISEIEQMFGYRIAELVRYESENKREDIPKDISWRIRKEEFLEHLAVAPIEAKMIALSDKLSNIKAIQRDQEQIGDEIWNRFNQKDKEKHKWYYCSVATLTQELDDFKIWKEYNEICNKIFK